MTSAITVAQALAEAGAAGIDRLDARLLLGAVLQRPRTWLIANDEAPLPDAELESYRQCIRRRASGEPVAYILGVKEFHGLVLGVGPGVLVPRPDTETLVDWAIELLRGPLAQTARPRVIDLGTGSGAIALAIRNALPTAQVTAVDASEAALSVARDNGSRLGLAVDWQKSNWWSDLPAGHFDLAVSNPPYVAAGDPHLDALRHEPLSALVAGEDGLDDIRRIVAGARTRLAEGGWLLLEHGHDQAGACAGILQAHGFVNLQSRADLAGILRCTGAQVAR